MLIKNGDIILRTIHGSIFLIDISDNYSGDKCALYEINETGKFLWDNIDEMENCFRMIVGSNDPLVQSHATMPGMMLLASSLAWGILLKNLKTKTEVNMEKKIFVPFGRMESDDAAAAKRKELAERLKRGEDVSVTSSGQVVAPDDPIAENGKTLKAPEGKLA